MTLTRTALACVAIAFGLITLAAGGSVLSGTDPGYIVFRPLLIYNVVMGAVYTAAGFLILRSLSRGKRVAAAIFFLNLLVLAIIGYLYTQGGAIASESLGAMTLRTTVWLAILLGLSWLDRRRIAGH